MRVQMYGCRCIYCSRGIFFIIYEPEQRSPPIAAVSAGRYLCYLFRFTLPRSARKTDQCFILFRIFFFLSPVDIKILKRFESELKQIVVVGPGETRCPLPRRRFLLNYFHNIFFVNIHAYILYRYNVYMSVSMSELY